VQIGAIAALVGTAFRDADADRKTEKYAEVLAHCANGGTFAIGETRLVTCVAVEVWTY
jgi:hypothetical protein